MEGATFLSLCPACNKTIPTNHMIDCGPCKGTGWHKHGTTPEQQREMMANAPEPTPEKPGLKVETIDLPNTLYILKDVRLHPEDQGELAADLDITTGEYLGLIFTSEGHAKRYIYIKGLEGTEVREVSFKGLLFLSRRLHQVGVIKQFILNHSGHIRREAKTFFVRDLASVPIKEDNWESRGV